MHRSATNQGRAERDLARPNRCTRWSTDPPIGFGNIGLHPLNSNGGRSARRLPPCDRWDGGSSAWCRTALAGAADLGWHHWSTRLALPRARGRRRPNRARRVTWCRVSWARGGRHARRRAGLAGAPPPPSLDGSAPTSCRASRSVSTNTATTSSPSQWTRVAAHDGSSQPARARRRGTGDGPAPWRTVVVLDVRFRPAPWRADGPGR